MHAKISRVGQNHIYTVYIWYFWLGIHQIYGVYLRIYTVLANPIYLIDLGANQRGARLDQGRFCAHSSHTKLVRRVGWRLQLYSRIRYGA